jgi:hypothetical protein
VDIIATVNYPISCNPRGSLINGIHPNIDPRRDPGRAAPVRRRARFFHGDLPGGSVRRRGHPHQLRPGQSLRLAPGHPARAALPDPPAARQTGAGPGRRGVRRVGGSAAQLAHFRALGRGDAFGPEPAPGVGAARLRAWLLRGQRVGRGDVQGQRLLRARMGALAAVERQAPGNRMAAGGRQTAAAFGQRHRREAFRAGGDV